MIINYIYGIIIIVYIESGGNLLNLILEYIGQNYITLMLLAGLTTILFANRHTKIEGVKYIWAVIGVVLVITVCEFTEYWCVKYSKPVFIMYIKAALCYNLHPLLILLELYLIAPVRKVILLLLPYMVNMFLVICDLFGSHFIYAYNSERKFVSGNLRIFPALLICFYIIILLKYSLIFFKCGDRSKAVIVIFMAFITIVTVYFEYCNIITDHTTEIVALDILIYYFYLSAIHYIKLQEKLHNSRLKLEKQKNELLMAQIQPHFINNSLMAIQAQCIDHPDIYESIKNFSRYLHSNFDNIGSSHSVTFKQELKNIKAYLALEKMNFEEKLQVKYDIESDDFLLPSLSVEPLVENAVRHGIAAREYGGTVCIMQREEDDKIIIEVYDIGKGRQKLTDNQKKRRGIGINNVRARLEYGNKGKLDLIPVENGMCARIVLLRSNNSYN